ncbi:MAG TPA: wax ester/triacylglycerol synthase family O-acyltransferase, partial [Acidimicrobiales bacterium]|nr:wax ester/triacylglycerol synthase family O-acyltransferase [Acidimicrobiales bacterium]
MTSYLNPLDSAFLLLETEGAAMRIGAVIELEGVAGEDPTTRYEQIKTNIAERLHEIPVLTQRVVRAPFDLVWPVLVEDQEFDLDRHLVRVALPSPGSGAQFDALVADFFSRPLSPQRPLWQLLLIEGLESGRSALALKVHHALADGVSGAETFANLFDISPDVREPLPRATEAVASDATTPLGLLWLNVRRLLATPTALLDVVTSWMARVEEVARALLRFFLLRTKRAASSEQPTIFEARRTSLNAAPGVDKEYHRTRVPLAEVKLAAKRRGVSVTDVVVASVSGALARFLVERGETLTRDLVAFVPINVRPDGESESLGNQISGMLVRLHTELLDREERVLAISKDAKKTLGEQRRRRAKIFIDVPRLLGPTLVSWGGRLLSALGLFN